MDVVIVLVGQVCFFVGQSECIAKACCMFRMVKVFVGQLILAVTFYDDLESVKHDTSIVRGSSRVCDFDTEAFQVLDGPQKLRPEYSRPG